MHKCLRKLDRRHSNAICLQARFINFDVLFLFLLKLKTVLCSVVFYELSRICFKSVFFFMTIILHCSWIIFHQNTSVRVEWQQNFSYFLQVFYFKHFSQGTTQCWVVYSLLSMSLDSHSKLISFVSRTLFDVIHMFYLIEIIVGN